jgi:hypothetical protein
MVACLAPGSIQGTIKPRGKRIMKNTKTLVALALLAEGSLAGRQGAVRVSGALAVANNGLFFDCVWILDIS